MEWARTYSSGSTTQVADSPAEAMRSLNPDGGAKAKSKIAPAPAKVHLPLACVDVLVMFDGRSICRISQTFMPTFAVGCCEIHPSAKP
jgi:hypothetical protein